MLSGISVLCFSSPCRLLSSTMAALRPLMLRFKLENISINGSPNGYKNPQLLLKSQVDPVPCVPYTGSQTQMPVRRHLLMVHVKDKADELERLDLDAFALSSPEIDPALRHSVTCLPSDRSLVFLFPKGTSKHRQTLKIKFKEPFDFIAVRSNLLALNITIDNNLCGHDAGFPLGQEREGYPMAPPSNKFIARPLSNPQNFYSNSSLPGLSSTPHNMYTSSSANTSQHMIPGHSPSQRMDNTGTSISQWHSWSPGLQPVTTIRIPGVLDEGLYKLSRVGSASGRRLRMSKPTIVPSVGGLGDYAVSNRLDTILSKEDSVLSPRSPFFWKDGPSRPQSQNAIPSLTRHESWSSVEYLRFNPSHGQAGELPGPSTGTASVLGNASQPTEKTPDTPSHVQPARASDGLLASGLNSQPSTHTSGGSATSRLHPGPVTFNAMAKNHHRVAAASTTAQSRFRGNTFSTQPSRNNLQNYGTNGIDDLLRVVEINQEGLSEATKLWNDLMERGQEATKAIENPDEAYSVLSKYAEEWAKGLDSIAAAAAQKMRRARYGNAAL
ncbi:hypothetical protein B0H67DRAFT_590067 [Lasiosphaeris hirsuta]|uniref:Uncharacterized protein n=1 Tax=Lasiosphaeris hirsuta TaxID=260670 RepID=A0AA40DP56_9PEZI|nr:hypothetical protein B0H67DRAFT_590067 [Lasiosphaeris hirsuta]